MARKKKLDEEKVELELELEPTEIDETDEALEASEDTSEDAPEEIEASEEEVEEVEAKAKPRKRRAPKRKAKAPEAEVVGTETSETAPLVAKDTNTSNPPATAPVVGEENNSKAFEQIAALVKQWEQSNAALTSQLEKLNQKIPSPTMKAATSWAPLARIAVGASAAAVVLAGLSLVFSHSVRSQVLQASITETAQLAHASERLQPTPAVSAKPTQQDLALESIARKARQEQAQLAFAGSKKSVHPAPVAPKKRRK